MYFMNWQRGLESSAYVDQGHRGNKKFKKLKSFLSVHNQRKWRVQQYDTICPPQSSKVWIINTKYKTKTEL